MPTGGPVASYPVTQGTGAQNQPYVQIQPQPPGADWSPEQIVEGFLTASASYGSYPQVANEYLTPTEQNTWNPYWQAVVYKTGPGVTVVPGSSTAKNPTASVAVTGTIQANLSGNGSYFLPSGGSSGVRPPDFQLVKVGTQWRISFAPQELLLTSNSFANDYQLRNLYFFDPQSKFLVPDPVYVPVQNPGNPMDRLVNELIVPPAGDWLSGGATQTAFPKGTKVSGVTLDGVTAVVNLTGTAIGKADDDRMRQVSAQLLWTLSVNASNGSNGQGVQSVEVTVNGKSWPEGQGNPVQSKPTEWSPAPGSSKEFYYITSDGYLARETAGEKPASIAKIGTGYSQIAVSPDGRYLAALRDGTLLTGLIDGPLTKRGGGFVAMSWDSNDDLLASASQGQQIVMFRGPTGTRQPFAPPVTVNVVGALGPPFTALQVAPDGVRVALVSGTNQLTFGGISGRTTGHPTITLSQVQESPPTQGQSVSAAVNFTALSWYGPDNVIALAGPPTSPTVTEYPVTGGTPAPLQAVPHMNTIAASYGEPLIAGLSKGRMWIDAGLTGSWTQITDGNTPANGNSPTYPG